MVARRPHTSRLPDLHLRTHRHVVTVWLAILTALGVAGWLSTIWATRRRMGWARWAATALFVLGTLVALTALLTKDTSGETGLAPLLGWIGLLPSVAGAWAVRLCWQTA